MLEHVDQGVALLWLIYRCPVRDTLESMPVKNFYGVVAESRQQFSQLSGRRVINAEFVDGGAFGIGVVLLCSGVPKKPGFGFLG